MEADPLHPDHLGLILLAIATPNGVEMNLRDM